MSIKNIAIGRKDLFSVNPLDIQEEAGWNVRNKTSRLDSHIRYLADSIKEVGLKEPLTVKMDGDIPILRDGHNRLEAIKLAISEGADIRAVEVILESKLANEADQVLGMILRNTGLPLAPIEQAEVFKRLHAFGWTMNEIAQKASVSRNHVDAMLFLTSLHPDILKMVKNDKISATFAIDTAKKNGNDAVKILKKSVQIAQEKGKGKATHKHTGEPRVQWRVVGLELSDVTAKLVEALEKMGGDKGLIEMAREALGHVPAQKVKA